MSARLVHGWQAATGLAGLFRGAVLGGVHLVLGLPDVVLALAGAARPAVLRVEARVLRDAQGAPVVRPDALRAALERAAAVLEEQARVRLVLGAPVVLDEPAPAGALNPPCDLPALWHALSPAAAFLRRHAARGTGLLGAGAPVTVFAVADVAPGRGKVGCSLGPLADHVVVEPRGLSRRHGDGLTVAHELGHACGLPHLGAAGTLMQPGSRGRSPRLTRWQVALMRTSRHVTRR